MKKSFLYSILFCVIAFVTQASGSSASTGLLLFRMKDRLPGYFARIGEERSAIIMAQLPGIDVDFQDTRGKTALHYAAQNGYPELAGVLLSQEADYTIKDSVGDTALMIARKNGQGVVESLISRAQSLHGA